MIIHGLNITELTELSSLRQVKGELRISKMENLDSVFLPLLTRVVLAIFLLSTVHKYEGYTHL